VNAALQFSDVNTWDDLDSLAKMNTLMDFEDAIDQTVALDAVEQPSLREFQKAVLGQLYPGEDTAHLLEED